MSDTILCGCIGPQNGEPLCPCRMRGVFQRDGRWIMPERDLGPVSGGFDPEVVGAMLRNLANREPKP